MSDKCVLICGPQWVPEEYYNYHYRERVAQLIDDGVTKFVLGAASGVDHFAQLQLLDAGVKSDRVTVYDKGTRDGRLDAKSFALRNGFDSYPERDWAMVDAASETLCVLPQFGGGQSGCLLPVLRKTLYAPDATLAAIRSASEPYDAELVEKITKVYAEHYDKKLYKLTVKRQKRNDDDDDDDDDRLASQK